MSENKEGMKEVVMCVLVIFVCVSGMLPILPIWQPYERQYYPVMFRCNEMGTGDPIDNFTILIIDYDWDHIAENLTTTTGRVETVNRYREMDFIYFVVDAEGYVLLLVRWQLSYVMAQVDPQVHYVQVWLFVERGVMEALSEGGSTPR